MSTKYKQEEERIHSVVEKLSDQPNPNLKKASRDFNVPYNRLRRRYLGLGSRCTRPAMNRLLSEPEELAICQYIRHLNELMIPARCSAITQFANTILEKRQSDPSSPAPKIGSHWVRRFLDRHSESFSEEHQMISVRGKGKSSPQLKDMHKWFERFQQIVNKHTIHPEDVYSFDEAIFQIWIERRQWVINLHSDQKGDNGGASTNNRDSVQMLEVVSGDGSVLPPMMILSSKHVQKEWAQGLEKEIPLIVSDSGCCSENMPCQWIRHFDKYSYSRQKGEYRLLLMSGYGPHTSDEFFPYCEKNKIIPLFFLPRTKHLVQPLGGIFQRESESTLRTTSRNLKNRELLQPINTVRQAVLTSDAVKASFKDNGLIPFHPEIVLDKIREHQPTTPASLPAPPQPEHPWITPETSQHFMEYQRLTDLDPGSDYFKDGLSKLLEGSLAQSFVIEQLRGDLEKCQAAQQASQALSNEAANEAAIGE